MRRLSIVAAILVAVGIGIVDPYACVRYGTGGGLQRELSKKERDSLLRVALRARGLVPSPGAGYLADRESDEASADAKAPWNDPAGKWTAPGAARAIRVYPPTDPDAADAPPAFETRIHVNEEAGLPQALTSVFDATRPFAVDGAVAVEVPTVGTSDATPADEGSGSEGGRLAMPMSPEAVAQSVTIVRIVVANPETERALRDALEGRAPALAAKKPVARADRIESVTVELYGAKRDVERVARRVPVAKLRALLSK